MILNLHVGPGGGFRGVPQEQRNTGKFLGEAVEPGAGLLARGVKPDEVARTRRLEPAFEAALGVPLIAVGEHPLCRPGQLQERLSQAVGHRHAPGLAPFTVHGEV